MKPADAGNRLYIKPQRRRLPRPPYAAPGRDSIHGCHAGKCRREAMLAVWVHIFSEYRQIVVILRRKKDDDD